MIRAPAQAGNRAGKTEHYLQWWEHSPEWNAVTSASRKRHDSSFVILSGLLIVCPLEVRVLVCVGISGLLVKYMVAIDVARVRFPADAFVVWLWHVASSKGVVLFWVWLCLVRGLFLKSVVV